MVSIRKIAASTKLGLAGFALVTGVLGCGSSTTNNDQGASFSALGFFTAATPEPPPGLSGFNAVLSEDGTPGSLGVASGFANQSRAFIGLENRLRNSFLRVTKIDCDYNVPGASIPIPSDSFAVSGFINASTGIGGPQIGGTGGSGGVGGASGGAAAGGDTGGDTGTSGSVSGGSATGTGTRLYLEFQTIGTAIYAYLNANRNALPELPFQVQIFCTATGITNAGKVVETNVVGLTAVMIEQTFVDSDGTAGGTGTGGDVSGFDGSDSTNDGDDTTTVGAGSSGATAPEGEIIPAS